MRVAVFTSRPPRAGTSFERELRALARAGMEIEVFALRPVVARRRFEELAPPHARVHHLDLRRSARSAGGVVRHRLSPAMRDGGAMLASAARGGLGPLAKTAYVLPQAWAWAAAAGPRFDHVLAYRDDSAGTCAYAFHRLLPRPVPFSLWVHGGGARRREPVYFRQKLAHADLVITCCEANRALLARAMPDLRDPVLAKTHVSHHGLDLAAYPYRAEGRNPHRAVVVGRLGKGKGMEDLLRAVFLVRVRGVELVVDLVGDGPQRDRLQALAVALGLGDRVRFRGAMRRADARQTMREAALLVHPAEGPGEGLPGAVPEAMALGTPVVAAAVGGVPDALARGCGVLVPPRDETTLADAIAGLLADPAARRRIAARARMRAQERFDLWKNGARLAELMRRAPGAEAPC
ncbi:MAG TPA: glycosyltransferase [Gemmatimonadales bacterium]|nr:glycosyltransferase [Gemmatimonadales bacterium]